MSDNSDERLAVVFNGFLALSMKEKAKLVDRLNEYFDYPEKREQIRSANESVVAELISRESIPQCPSCRR